MVETHHRNVVIVEKNKENSIGICQVKLKTARWLGFMGTEKELLKPEINIYYASLYLNYQYNRYGNWARAVNAYNRGKSESNDGSKYVNKVFNEYIKYHSK